MSVKIVGIMGSPRVGGNTDLMVGWVLDAAKEAGAEVERIILKDRKIEQCRGCDTCTKPPYRCIHKDDMDGVQAVLEGAQAFVLGTPVYWWGPSGFMKTFVDRWYGFRGDRRGTIRGKKFGLVAPMGDSDPATGRHVVGMFQDAMDYLGCELGKPVLAPDCGDPGEVKNKPDVKAECVELGKWLYRAATNRQG